MTDETKTGDLGGYLARILGEKNMTPRQLAETADIPAAELSDWLTRRAIDPALLRRAADTLSVPTADLFEAAGRHVPGPLSRGQEQRILDLFRELEEEQKRQT